VGIREDLGDAKYLRRFVDDSDGTGSACHIPETGKAATD